MNRKWVIFDVMGVIFKVGDDTNDLLVPFVWRYNKSITREEINDEYIKASSGVMTSVEFWKKMRAVAEGEEERICEEYLDTCLTVDEKFISIAKVLKEKYNLAILSNDVSEWSEYLRKKYDIDSVVTLSVISGDVKVRKPNKEIYDIILEQTGAAPKDCIFIDDRTKNLTPAKERGMHTIKFNRERQTSDDNDDICITDFEELYGILASLWGG